MKTIRMVSIFLARLFLSAIFLVSGVNQLFNWHETENSLLNALCEWQSNAGFSQAFQDCLTVLVPWVSVLLILGVLFELIGGLMVLIGYREKVGACLLILFLIPVTLLFHSFWFLEGSSRDLQSIMFFKNLAILGGVIFVSLFGAQAKEGGSSSPMGFS